MPSQRALADRIERIAAFVARATGAEAVKVTAVSPLSGGAIQENWALDADVRGGSMAGRHALVARTDAASGVAASRGRADEFRLLQTAFKAGVAVPEPLWLDADGEIVGRPLFLMRRVAGTAAGHRLVRTKFDAEQRAILVETLGRALARIHAVRPPREDLAFLGRPPSDPARAAIEELRRHLDQLPRAYPALEWGLRRLELDAPRPGDVVLAHRDYRIGNIMIDGTRVAGILDWEFAGWSDRHEDVGWFMARCWRFGNDAREAGGLGDREDFYRGYAAESGREIEDERVRYWEAMAHARWAAIAAGQGDRFVSGGERTLELALTAHIVPELELELLRMTRTLGDAR